MALQQLTFSEAVNQLITAFNATSKYKANTGVGSPLGAVFNAVALLSMDLQLQLLYNNNVSRLLTSSGTDIDTFTQIFGVYRELAVSATNSVVFTLNSVSGINQYINVGAVIQTPSGIQFQVVADTSQSAWSTSSNAYVILAGSLSAQVTVSAIIPGSSGNVQPLTITQIVSVPGVITPSGMTVSNTLSFINGSDEEVDQALIARFQQFMSNRFATIGAVTNAVDTTQNGLTYSVLDMSDIFGNYTPSFFTVVVNILGNNSGCPSAILNSVYASVLANRPVGMPFSVQSPILVPVTISATLTLTPGASPTNIINNATSAVATYLNNIGLSPIGANTTASFSEITAILIAVPGVANVTNLQLNSATYDITATVGQQIVSNTFSFATQ